MGFMLGRAAIWTRLSTADGREGKWRCKVRVGIGLRMRLEGGSWIKALIQ